jgi:hypothetical protein
MCLQVDTRTIWLDAERVSPMLEVLQFYQDIYLAFLEDSTKQLTLIEVIQAKKAATP